MFPPPDMGKSKNEMKHSKLIYVKVTHYYNYPVLYPFMPEILFNMFEDAFLNRRKTVLIPKQEFDMMIAAYLDTLKN
jgi:hypothetical protein